MRFDAFFRSGVGRRNLVRRADDPATIVIRTDCGGSDAIAFDVAGIGRGARAELPRNDQGVAGVFDAHLGAQYEFAHALQSRRENFARQYGSHAARMRQQIYECQHAALRARISSQDRRVVGQALRVVGHLTL